MRVPRIYAIADADRWAPQPLPEVVARLAAAGWPWIQVRAKRATDAAYLSLAEECVVAAGNSSRVWINDRADIAAMVGAYGVHIGDADPPAQDLHKSFPGLRIGRTTRDPQAVSAADAEAAVDIVSLGPLFASSTKIDAPAARGVAVLDAARDCTDKPLVAIGGIVEHAIPDLRWAGADVVAVSGALADRPELVAEWVSRYAEPANIAWPRVFLIGFMVAGKSCVGRRLAAVLGWRFSDLDRLVMQGAKRTVPEIFEAEGEAGFRARESAALRQAIGRERTVVACGGGVLESSANRELLATDAGTVVWLDVADDEIERRLRGSARRSRPLADNDWGDRLRLRRGAYTEAADVAVPVQSPETIGRTTRRVYDRLALHPAAEIDR